MTLIGSKINRFSKLESTNLFIKENINKNIITDGEVVLADFQIFGKGQGANKWESEGGKNLTFSFLLNHKCKLTADEQFIISIFTSISIIETLKIFSDKQFQIKWPNDIYYNDNKIAGILIENFVQGNNINKSIIGIGLNINQVKFKSNAPNPISLYNIENKEFCLDQVLDVMILKLNNNYKLIKNGDKNILAKTYKSNLYRLNDYYKYIINDNELDAKIIDINKYGQIVIETENKEKKELSMNEIKYII